MKRKCEIRKERNVRLNAWLINSCQKHKTLDFLKQSRIGSGENVLRASNFMNLIAMRGKMFKDC